MNRKLHPFQARVHHSRWKPIGRLGAWLQNNDRHWNNWSEGPFRLRLGRCEPPASMRGADFDARSRARTRG